LLVVCPNKMQGFFEGVESPVLRIEQKAVHKAEKPLAGFFSGFGEGTLVSCFVIEVKCFRRGPVEVVLEGLPVGADFGGSLEDSDKGGIVLESAEVNAGGADGSVHGYLLGGPFDVLRYGFRG